MTQELPKLDFIYSRQKLRAVITPRRLSVTLERHGRKWVSTCPFHDPAAKSLFFFDSLGYWEFKCTECGVGGDLIDFITHVHFSHLDGDKAREASMAHWIQLLSNSEKAILAEKSDDHNSWLQSGVFERSRVLDSFAQYCAWALEKGSSASDWLKERGWTLDQSRINGIGFFNGEIDPFLDYCALNGIDQSLVFFYLDQLDASREPCITVPARNSKGQIYTIYGQRMSPNDAAGDYYAFSSVSGDVPFNITPNVQNPIVVPGLFDALTADLLGIPGVVSLMRKRMTQGHIYKLKACGAESLTLVLERGENRLNQEQEVEQFLHLATSLGLTFKSVLLPKGYTTEKFLRTHGAQEFDNLLQTTAPDTSRTRRRSIILQEISESYEENMSRAPGEIRGWNLERFPQLAKHLGGVQPGYYLVSSHAFFDKSAFLISFGMDLLESNPCKMIYVTFEMPRKQIFNRLISFFAGVSYTDVLSRQSTESENQNILEATKNLMGYVRSNRLEIWDDNQVTDDRTLLRMLREEVQENRNVFVCIDGFYRICAKTRPDIPDIDERRSAVMLDIYKTLGIPVFCTGDMELSKWVSESRKAPQLADIIAPQAYVRDPGYVLFLSTSPEGEMELQLLKNRMGGTPLRVSLETDKSGTHLHEKT